VEGGAASAGGGGAGTRDSAGADTGVSDAGDGAGMDAGPAAGRPWFPRRWPGRPVRRVAAVAVLVLAVLASGGLLVAAHSLRDPAARSNHALTDSAGTARVVGDVSSALTRIFGYGPQDTDATERAAREVLSGTAASQYQALFGQIRDRVAEQHLTLTTRVVRAGVVSLTGDRARLLVFLDQTAQRAGARATGASAQLSVTAEYRGGRWRIAELKAR
jgi:Mce-associated membrane protein